MSTSEVTEKRLEKLKGALAEISSKEAEKPNPQRIRQVKKRIKRLQRKLRKSQQAKKTEILSKTDSKE